MLLGHHFNTQLVLVSFCLSCFMWTNHSGAIPAASCSFGRGDCCLSFPTCLGNMSICRSLLQFSHWLVLIHILSVIGLHTHTAQEPVSMANVSCVLHAAWLGYIQSPWCSSFLFLWLLFSFIICSSICLKSLLKIADVDFGFSLFLWTSTLLHVRLSTKFKRLLKGSW